MAPSYTNGRRGPNVSHFLRDLNTVADRPLDEPEFTFEDDLAMFTNTQFFDYETGQNTDYQAHPIKHEMDSAPSSAVSPTAAELTSPAVNDMANLDFMSGEFNFGDFNGYHGSGVPPFHEGLGNLQPLQPNPQAHYAPAVPQSAQQNAYVQTAPATADSRRESIVLNSSSRVMNFEDQSRVAAEEDKRRRNTAASARFRIKKKQREQALEKSAKDMTDKVNALENRINLLETENRWLKNLVMEKNDGNDEITAMFKEFDSKHKASKAASQSSSSSSDSIRDDEA